MPVQIGHHQFIIKIINNTDETNHYTLELSMGIVDIQSLRYYNVRKASCPVADPGFPIGGANLVGGVPTPEADTFRKICMSK